MRAAAAGDVRRPAAIIVAQDTPFNAGDGDFTLGPREVDGIQVPARQGRGAAVIPGRRRRRSNYEFHAEPDGAPRGYAQTYEKARAAQQASGTLTAPFPGIHGWFWENTDGSGNHGDADERRLLQPVARVPHRLAVKNKTFPEETRTAAIDRRKSLVLGPALLIAGRSALAQAPRIQVVKDPAAAVANIR